MDIFQHRPLRLATKGYSLPCAVMDVCLSLLLHKLLLRLLRLWTVLGDRSGSAQIKPAQITRSLRDRCPHAALTCACHGMGHAPSRSSCRVIPLVQSASGRSWGCAAPGVVDGWCSLRGIAKCRHSAPQNGAVTSGSFATPHVAPAPERFRHPSFWMGPL
jgi:hypothetical protein